MVQLFFKRLFAKCKEALSKKTRKRGPSTTIFAIASRKEATKIFERD